jgi:hypothetical protein
MQPIGGNHRPVDSYRLAERYRWVIGRRPLNTANAATPSVTPKEDFPMSIMLQSVSMDPIAVQPLTATLVSSDGKEILDVKAAFAAWGYTNFDAARAALPQIVQGGVQSAPTGAIEDPAGSAIGGSFSGAGGGSGAIYAHFNGLPNPADHLQPIPKIAMGAAIFNTSSGAGRRVVHTYSPLLGSLRPLDEGDRGNALTQIANGYYNTIIAFDRRSTELGPDGALLNLVPISAGIYAGSFASTKPSWGPTLRHLDPSYTLTAVLLAIAQVLTDKQPVPTLSLYYFDAGPCADAAKLAKALQSGT